MANEWGWLTNPLRGIESSLSKGLQGIGLKAEGGIATKATSIKPKLTPVQQSAITVSRNLRMGAWINKNPVIQQKLAYMNTKVQQEALRRAGTTLTKPQYQALYNVNLHRQGAISGYLNVLSGSSQTMQEATQAGAVTTAQLAQTTGAYENLLNNPPTAGDIDIKQLLVYGAIAAGGLILISMFLNRRK
jgi:hypothetical protein